MTVCPFARWRPVESHSGPMTEHRGLVLHVQVGDNSCYAEFSIPANQASSTWWVSKTGVLEQYVDADMMAWAEAQGNGTWDSVETEGEPVDPLTAAQVAMLSRLYQWGHSVYGWPYQMTDDPAGRGFGWHGMGGEPWGSHYGCPGEIRKGQRPAILAAARALSPPPPASVAQGEPDMAVFQYAHQEHTVTVDPAGILVHRYVPANQPGVPAAAWTREVLARGCIPGGTVAVDVAFNGQLHVYAGRPDGQQAHCWFAPPDGWKSEVQP